MKIKLFESVKRDTPDHEFDVEDYPALDVTSIIHVAQTNKYYTLGYAIKGEDAYAFFEADVVSVNFSVHAFGDKS